MENNDTINELYSHLEEINSTEITPDIFQKEIDNYKFYFESSKMSYESLSCSFVIIECEEI